MYQLKLRISYLMETLGNDTNLQVESTKLDLSELAKVQLEGNNSYGNTY